VIPVEFVSGLACGLAVAAAAYAAFWFWTRRIRSSERLPVGVLAGHASGGPVRAQAAPAAGSGEAPVAAEPRTPSAPGEPPSDPAPPVPSECSPDSTPIGIDGPMTPPRPSAPGEAVRLSQRVILHVYAQGDLPPGAVAPPGLCQAGIGEALGISQGGLAAVLRRLEAAGLFTTERGHVQGRDRRLKIYRLSARGLEVAKDLRTRSRRTPHRPSGQTKRTE
jgi:DNA-binding MarR family transcriptional regulator